MESASSCFGRREKDVDVVELQAFGAPQAPAIVKQRLFQPKLRARGTHRARCSDGARLQLRLPGTSSGCGKKLKPYFASQNLYVVNFLLNCFY
jgi:hypothetical protein